MMKTFKKAFTLLFLVLLFSAVFICNAEASADGDFVIDTNGVLTKYNGSDAEVVVPDNVTSIGRGAFYNNTMIEKVIVPSGVTTIGSSAFSYCYALKEVEIQGVLTSIGSSAFYYCKELASISLANSKLTSIADYTFYCCSSLASIGLPDTITSVSRTAFDSQTKKYCSVDSATAKTLSKAGQSFFVKGYPNVCLLYSGDELEVYPCDKNITTAELPEGVTRIKRNAFAYCNNLTQLVLPYGFETLEAYAIHDCKQLKSVTLPRTLSEVENPNFQNCPALVLEVNAGSPMENWVTMNAVPFVYAEGSSIRVNVKEDAAKDYAGLSLVLSGDGVSTSRKMDGDTSWSFNGIREGRTYTLQVKNSYGQALSDLVYVTAEEGVTKSNAPALRKNVNIQLAVRGDDMKNVSDTAEIVWTDAQGTELAKGAALTSIPVDTKLNAKIRLMGEPALVYAQPEPYAVTVSEKTSAVSVYLKRAEGNSRLGIALSGTYTAANESQSTFTAWDSLRYAVQNVTKNEDNLAYVISDNQLSLGTQITAGDELCITVSSPNDDFLPVTENVVVSGNTTLDLTLVQRGVLTANYDCADGADMLVYDASGRLTWSGDADSGSLSTIGLPDGQYSVLLMRRGLCTPAPSILSTLGKMGFAADKDYVLRSMVCTQGAETTEDFGALPEPQHSGGYFNLLTFAASQASPVAGRYFTLKAAAEWKDAFAPQTADAVWTLELPDTMSYSAETLSLSGQVAGNVTFDGNRITVPLGNLSDVMRICLIPLCGGSMEINGTLDFTLEGEHVTLPMEPVRIQATPLTIFVPKKVNVTTIQVRGELAGKGDIAVYDNGVLAGQTKADGSGTWSAQVELVKPYTYTNHTIQAVFSGPYGEITSDTASVLYQYVEKPIRVKSVFLKTNTHGSNAVNLEIPMVNGHVGESYAKSSSISSYLFNPHDNDISFDIHFEGEDLSKLETVKVVLGLSNGTTLTIPAEKKSDTVWTCSRAFNSNALPATITVSFDAEEGIVISSEEMKQYKDAAASERDDGDGYMEYYNMTTLSVSNVEPEMQETYHQIVAQISEVNQMQEQCNAVIDQYNQTNEALNQSLEALSADSTSLMDSLSDGNGNFFFSKDSDPIISMQSVPSLSVDQLLNAGFVPVPSTGDTPAYKNETPNDTTVYVPGDPSNPGSHGTKIHVKKDWTVDVDAITHSPLVIIADSIPNETMSHVSTVGNITNEMGDLIPKLYNNEMQRGWLEDLKGKQSNVVDAMKKWGNNLDDEIRVMEAEKQTYGNNPYPEQQKLNDTKRIRKALEADTKAQSEALKKTEANITAATDRAAKVSRASLWAKAASRAISGASAVNDAMGICSLLEKFYRIFEWRQIYPNDPLLEEALARAINLLTIKSTMLGFDAVAAFRYSPTGWGAVGCLVGLNYLDLIESERFLDIYDNLEYKYGYTPMISPGKYNPESPAEVKGIIDPSGFVYEAVLSNKVEGAESSVWQKQTLYDQYDEPYEVISLWNAEDYGQDNPQTTDFSGVFAWDVPDGLWQVRVTKDGYEDAASEWLTVPPIQTDIHIGIVSREAPMVESVSRKGDALIVRFEKYMDVSTLKNSVRLTINGASAGTLSFPDAEEDPKDSSRVYARTASVALPSPLAVDTKLVLTVTTGARSYAGVPLETQYQYQETILNVESLKVLNQDDQTMELLKDQEAYLTLTAVPAAAAAGKTITVSGDLEALGIAEDTTITLNAFGRGSLPVRGVSYGSFHLSFALSGSTLTTEASVNVGARSLALVQDEIILASDIDLVDTAELQLKGDETTAADLSWSSDHPEVVCVQDGVLTAIGGGTATVTGTLLEKSVQCSVRVLKNANGVHIPSGLTVISEETFRNDDSIEYAILSGNIQEIGDYAFADDDSLQIVYIPASVNSFGKNIFNGTDAVTVFVDAGSIAESWCRTNGLTYQYAK